MEQNVPKKRRLLWYAVYGFLLTIGLLYYLFPSDDIRDYLRVTAARANPPLLLLVEKISPSLSIGLDFLNVKLALKRRPDNIFFRSAEISVRPGLLSLFQGKPRFSFDAEAYGGNVEGALHLTRNNFNAPLTAQVQLTDIHIGDIAYLSSLTGHKTKGLLGGTLTYNKKSNLPIDGTGEAHITVTDGLIKLSEPILSFEKIEFNELFIKMALKNRKLNLTRFELKGRDVKGTLSGTINLKNRISKSTLNLRGQIEPLAGILEGLGGDEDAVRLLRQLLKGGKRSFVINGTLDAPIFRFI
jgi:type II secretion system protein N